MEDSVLNTEAASPEAGTTVNDFIRCLEKRLDQILPLASGDVQQGLLAIRNQLILLSPLLNSGDVPAKNWLPLADSKLVSKLHARCPELSLTELKVCVLLEHQLCTKEIAKMLCLSQRSVENHRYRVRKKLGIQRGARVESYLRGYVLTELPS